MNKGVLTAFTKSLSYPSQIYPIFMTENDVVVEGRLVQVMTYSLKSGVTVSWL